MAFVLHAERICCLCGHGMPGETRLNGGCTRLLFAIFARIVFFGARINSFLIKCSSGICWYVTAVIDAVDTGKPWGIPTRCSIGIECRRRAGYRGLCACDRMTKWEFVISRCHHWFQLMEKPWNTNIHMGLGDGKSHYWCNVGLRSHDGYLRLLNRWKKEIFKIRHRRMAVSWLHSSSAQDVPCAGWDCWTPHPCSGWRYSA